jgi:hypothetical protein
MNIIKKFILFETENKSYSFDELSEESKKNAIAQIRSGMLEGKYGAEDIPGWVIDDDFLFEPTHKELTKVFGIVFFQYSVFRGKLCAKIF